MFISKKSTAFAAMTLLISQAAAAPVKYRSAGYYAYAYSSFDSCSPYYGGGIDVSLYGAQSKFQATGKTGFKSTSQYDDFSAYFDFVSSCAGDTVNFVYGSAYGSSYDSAVSPLFTIATNKLASATLNDVQVPTYRYSCTYECTEVCYAEIFGYGSCPPDEPYLECYFTSCSDYEYAGVASVDITWVDPLASKTPLMQSSSSYRVNNPQNGYSSFYKSKGSSRYTTVTIAATLDGVTILPSQPSYSEGYLSSTTSMDISK